MSLRQALRRLHQYLRHGPEPLSTRKRSRFLHLEPLEDRALPATINWTNRGLASDNFASVFGANAELARRVVDAAISSWRNVIFRFNQPGGGDTINITISMAGSGTGHGGYASVTNSNGGWPTAGSITVLRGNGGTGGGWFLDPTPYEDSEFRGECRNAFAMYAQAGSPAFNQADLLSVVTHEIGHVLGYTANLRLRNFSTNTGVRDNTAGGFYWAFVGPSGFHHLLTSSNGGSDAGQPLHAAQTGDPAFPINFGGRPYWGTDDLMNPFFQFSQRHLISNTAAFVLRDAYNYTTGRPDAIRTCYAIFNPPDGELLLRGRMDGVSNDTIVLRTDTDGSLVVTINQSNPVPGTAITTPLTSLWSPGSVRSIRVETGGGNDVIHVQSLSSGMPLILRTGGGNDVVRVTGPSGDLRQVRSTITFDGGVGTDSVLLLDDLASGNPEYTITSSSFTQVNGPARFQLNYSNVEGLMLYANAGANTATVQSSSAAVTLDMGGGNDIVLVGNVAGTLADIQGPLTVRGGGGRDTLRLNDAGNPAGQIYTFAGNQVRRTGMATITYEAIAVVEVRAGGQDDLFDAQSTPAGTTLELDGGGGNDYLVGPNAAAQWGVSGFTSDTGGLTSAVFGGPVNFAATENLIGGSDTDIFYFGGLATLSGYVDGGGSTNTLDYADYINAVYVDLWQYLASTMAFVLNVQNVLGTNQDDLLRGDDGSNVLDGRGGRDIVIGMGGDDQCQGGGGRDIAIGGTGKDLLEGGSDEDILIDGYTNYDQDDVALTDLWNEWVRTDLGYADRVNNLRYGGGVSAYLLDWGVNVFNDGEVDTLYGETAAGGFPELDWFFLDPFDVAMDLVSPPEEVN